MNTAHRLTGTSTVTRRLAACLLVASSPLACANLLVNPGFENDLTGWTATGGAAIMTSDPPPYQGAKYVFGDSTPGFTVSQTIDLAASGFSAGAVDAGNLSSSFGGYQSGWHEQRDYGTISLRFLDGSGAEIRAFSLAPFFSNHTWVLRSGKTLVPAGTRTIVYHFEGVREDGNDADAFLDSTFLDIAPLAPEISVQQPKNYELKDGAANLNFGSARRKTTGKTKTFAIRNVGDAKLTGISLAVKGKHKKEFKITKSPKTALAPGGASTFRVTFTPKKPGLRKAVLIIRSNDEDEKNFDIRLKGKGKK